MDIPADWIGSQVTMMLKIAAKAGEITMARGKLVAIIPGGIIVAAEGKENAFNADHLVHVSRESTIQVATTVPEPRIKLA